MSEDAPGIGFEARPEASSPAQQGRLCVIQADHPGLTRLLRGSREFLIWSTLPRDVEVVDIYRDATRNRTMIVVASAEFVIVPMGYELPMIDVTFYCERPERGEQEVPAEQG